MFALSLLALAAVAAASPVITAPPVVERAAPTPADITTIPVVSCLANIECCAATATVPLDPGSIATLLPGLTSLPIPLPTLGPLLGFMCSSATDLSILGNQW